MAVKKSRIFPGFTFVLHLQKGMHRSKPGMWKGYHLSKGRDLFCQKWYIKGYVVGPRGGASPCNTLLSTPHGGTPLPVLQLGNDGDSIKWRMPKYVIFFDKILRASDIPLHHYNDGDSIKWRMPKYVIFFDKILRASDIPLHHYVYSWGPYIITNSTGKGWEPQPLLSPLSPPQPAPLDLRKSCQSSKSLRGYDLIPDMFRCDFGVILDSPLVPCYAHAACEKTLNMHCMYCLGQLSRDKQVFCLFPFFRKLLIL